MRRGCLISLLLVVLGWTAPVHALDTAAAALPLELDWQAPIGCPQAEQIRAELATLARARPGRELSPLTASGTIQARGRRFVLLLTTEVRGQRGRTVLEAARCAELQRAASLVLILVFGDAVELREESIAPPSAAIPAAARVEPTVAPRAAPVSDGGLRSNRSPTPARWQLEASVAMALGLLPSPGVGPRAGFHFRRGRWSLRASLGAYFAPAESLNEHVRIRLWAATLAPTGCYAVLLRAPALLAACAGIDVGVIAGSASGARSNRSAIAPQYGFAPSLLFVSRREPLALFVNAGASLTPQPARFVVEAAGSFHVRGISPFAALGVAF